VRPPRGEGSEPGRAGPGDHEGGPGGQAVHLVDREALLAVMVWATRPASTRRSRAVNGRGRSASRRVPLPDGGPTALGAFAFGPQRGL
jgi:hypothetical protein